MIALKRRNAARQLVCLAAVSGIFAGQVMAQYGGGGGTTGGATGAGGGATGGVTTGSGGMSGGGAASVYNFHGNYHLGFDSPEAWGLKYFASTTLLNGLQPPDSAEGSRPGAISIGLETGWLPTLDAGQTRIGFKGTVRTYRMAEARAGVGERFRRDRDQLGGCVGPADGDLAVGGGNTGDDRGEKHTEECERERVPHEVE
jgi:hypothetical protein